MRAALALGVLASCTPHAGADRVELLRGKPTPVERRVEHLAMRRDCSASTPRSVLVDLRLDGTEQPSPLALAVVSSDWVARRCAQPPSTEMRSCTEGFLAHDGTKGWFVDGLLTTATPAPWLANATLHAATSTGTGYVGAFGHDDEIELVRIDPAANDRVMLAEGYDLPAEGVGCTASGGASLAPVLAPLALLLLRRRRHARCTMVGANAGAHR